MPPKMLCLLLYGSSPVQAIHSSHACAQNLCCNDLKWEPSIARTFFFTYITCAACTIRYNEDAMRVTRASCELTSLACVLYPILHTLRTLWWKCVTVTCKHQAGTLAMKMDCTQMGDTDGFHAQFTAFAHAVHNVVRMIGQVKVFACQFVQSHLTTNVPKALPSNSDCLS